MGIIGIAFFILMAWLCSVNRKAIQWKIVLIGFSLQLVFALLILGIPKLGVPGVLSPLFAFANNAVLKLISYSDAGVAFLFGPLADVENIGGFIFVVKVLPIIIFFSSVMAVLYHVGIMQLIVKQMARLMHKTMGVSGAESLAAAGNVFIGQTEAPLVIKPFIKSMTQSELMSLMSGGMATVAGSVMAAYVGLLSGRIPDIAGHLLTASVMSAPAAILFAKILVPETETPVTAGGVHDLNNDDLKHENVIDAAASGASDGLYLALNVGAMLLAFVALIALANGLLSEGLGLFGVESIFGRELSFQTILGFLFTPLALLMGIPWEEAFTVGQMIGEKTILNEFVAYLSLSNAGAALSDRTVIITSYALCGFANLSSIAIQIGGIGSLAPSRRADLSRLGLRAVLAGSLAAFMTASVASFLV